MGFGGQQGASAINVPPTKVTITYAQFKAASVPGTFPIATAAGTVIDIIKVKHTVAFAAPTLATATVNISSTTNSNYLGGNPFNVFQAPAATKGQEGSRFAGTVVVGTILNQTSAGVFNVIITLGGDVVASLTAGSVDIWYTQTICI